MDSAKAFEQFSRENIVFDVYFIHQSTFEEKNSISDQFLTKITDSIQNLC